VLDDGKLMESGTHDELISCGGLYKKMFEEYGRAVEWKVGA
jgi:ATP-binding cassette subfamily B protein